MVSPSPRILPSASANGPEANSTPFFSRPIMYSRWRGKCSAIASGAAPPLGEDDVELFTKHGLGELADALLRHRVPPFRAACCAPLPPCTAASMARRMAAIKDRARGPTHSVPLFLRRNSFTDRLGGH